MDAVGRSQADRSLTAGNFLDSGARARAPPMATDEQGEHSPFLRTSTSTAVHIPYSYSFHIVDHIAAQPQAINMLRASLPRNLRSVKPAAIRAAGFKDFAFGNDARARMAAGVDILAKAVSATLGPKVRQRQLLGLYCQRQPWRLGESQPSGQIYGMAQR